MDLSRNLNLKYFVKKLFVFLIPFILIGLNYLRYEKNGSDLSRLSKTSIKKEYRTKINNKLIIPQKFLYFSELDAKDTSAIDLFVLGDSFSFRGSFSYQNYISNMSDLKIVTYDYFSEYNQIQTLFFLANSDIFNKNKVKYVVLQSVERLFIERCRNINRNDTIDLEKFYFTKDKQSEKQKKVEIDIILFEIYNDIKKYFLYNLFYYFDERAFYSPVYKMNLTKKMFSSRENKLLFFDDDISSISNNSEDFETINNELNTLSNKLSEKNIQLIVLPSPDKYDMYSDYIIDNKLEKNNFFRSMSKLKKDYIYIDSKKVLLQAINNNVLDVYYFGDTHWSPIAAKIIASEILSEINE